jgi:hypothetical protein
VGTLHFKTLLCYYKTLNCINKYYISYEIYLSPLDYHIIDVSVIQNSSIQIIVIILHHTHYSCSYMYTYTMYMVHVRFN